MQSEVFQINFRAKETILALGPESSGNFSVFWRGKIYFCRTGLDLLPEENFEKFKKLALGFLRKEKIKPDIILTDLHPRYRTTVWGKELARRYNAKNIKVQHHIAHIFSSVGDKIVQNSKFKIQNSFCGIACDGTGYGTDGKIWGGEVFKISNFQFPISNKISNKISKFKSQILRIGHLENQTLIGGDWAVREPARMLISIFNKFLDKKKIYEFVKKYYSANQFELIYNQLQAAFNCQETSSTARVLDAVSVLLGFSGNRRNRKHGPVLALEQNSTKPYKLEPKIIYNSTEGKYIFRTTPLFIYLLKNFKNDKKRLAATAQLYLAQGLHRILQKIPNTQYSIHDTFFSGGMANNKIMAEYFSFRGFYLSRKIPRGDDGLSFGQIIYYLSKFSKCAE